MKFQQNNLQGLQGYKNRTGSKFQNIHFKMTNLQGSYKRLQGFSLNLHSSQNQHFTTLYLVGKKACATHSL
jgi:hypothetical protein